MGIVYLIFFFLILRFTVTLFNFISNPKLTRSPRRYQDLVSILIHLEHDEHDVNMLLESILEQDYHNFEVIVLDDRVSGKPDPSYHLADDRFKVIKGKKNPDARIKKNSANHQLAGVARGSYLMFLQADILLADGLINNAVHRMKISRLALLSIFPNQIMQSFGERIVVPLMNFVLLNLLPLRLIRLLKSPVFSAASEDFMLFDAANYHQCLWHKQVKGNPDDSVEIMRLVKDAGFSAEALLANGYMSSRPYRNFWEASKGFSQTLLAGFNNNIFGLLAYLTLVIFGPVYIAYYLDIELLFFAFSLIILSKIMISLNSGQNAFVNIVLHPLQIVSLFVTSFWAVKWRILKMDENGR